VLSVVKNRAFKAIIKPPRTQRVTEKVRKFMEKDTLPYVKLSRTSS